MRIIHLRQRDYNSPAQVHARLARSLSFPDYYGANFAALNDCMSELDEPTLLVIEKSPDVFEDDSRDEASNEASDEYNEWFEKFCRIVQRIASEEELLKVSIRNSLV